LGEISEAVGITERAARCIVSERADPAISRANATDAGPLHGPVSAPCARPRREAGENRRPPGHVSAEQQWM